MFRGRSGSARQKAVKRLNYWCFQAVFVLLKSFSSVASRGEESEQHRLENTVGNLFKRCLGQVWSNQVWKLFQFFEGFNESAHGRLDNARKNVHDRIWSWFIWCVFACPVLWRPNQNKTDSQVGSRKGGCFSEFGVFFWDFTNIGDFSWYVFLVNSTCFPRKRPRILKKYPVFTTQLANHLFGGLPGLVPK